MSESKIVIRKAVSARKKPKKASRTLASEKEQKLFGQIMMQRKVHMRKEVGRNLAKIRKNRLGMNRGELSRAIQVTRQALSSIERGGALVTIDTLKALKEFMGIQYADVIDGIHTDDIVGENEVLKVKLQKQEQEILQLKEENSLLIKALSNK